MMKVRLLAHTPDPERLIAAAAKNCYSSVDVDGILDGLTEEKTQSFLQMLTEIGHESPIEHVSFTFAIEGVSRSLLAQITRHRMASYSVQSQRYVREKGFEYVVPPEIEKIPAAKAQFIQAMEDDQSTYEALTALCPAQRLHDPHRHDRQCTFSAKLLPPALLQPCTVGDSCTGRRNVQACLCRSTHAVPSCRPAVRVRSLHGRQNDLRSGKSGSRPLFGTAER